MGRYKGDISVHSVILNGSNFDCTIDGVNFSVFADHHCQYSIRNSSYNFEDFITENFGISTQELTSIYDANGKELCSTPSRTHVYVTYCRYQDIQCYLLSILRRIMTMCIDIDVVNSDNSQFKSVLGKCGLTTIPYGDHCLLYPDIEKYRDEQTYDYEDIVDTEEPCVYIHINRKKRLTLDFH